MWCWFTPFNRRGPRRLAARVLGVAGVVALVPACAQQPSHELVEDPAGILSQQALRRIQAHQESLLSEKDIELAIVLLADSPADLDREAHDWFVEKKVGARTRASRGVLLMIDDEADQVRMDIGTDLEHVYPDAIVSRIERNQFAPFFASGRVSDGIEATLELLVEYANDAVARGVYDPNERRASNVAGSAGAGARTNIDTTQANSDRRHPDAHLYGPQKTPEDALATYVQVLKQRIKDPRLRLYTPESRSLFSERLVTNAQQDRELELLRRSAGSAEFILNDSLAVALFGTGSENPPYFFRRGEAGWMLDFEALNRVVVFDFENRWHLKTNDHPYRFAFEPR